MNSSDCDICIVGCGPAGAAAAITFARAGRNVIVLDRGEYERMRPGEHLAPESVSTLASLGIAFDAVESPGTVALWDRAEPMYRPSIFNPYGGARTVVRSTFDQSLTVAVQAVGAEFRSGHRVVGGASSHVGLQLTVANDAGTYVMNPHFVIDATGRHGSVARRMGARVLRADNSIALVAWTPPDPLVAGDLRMLHIEAVVDGWWYAVALPDARISLTLFTTMDAVRRRGLSFRQFWASALTASVLVAPLLPASVSALPFRVFPSSPAVTTPRHGRAWIATGDAALQHDPLNGIGVQHSLLDGIRCAELALFETDARAREVERYSGGLYHRHMQHRHGRIEVYEAAESHLGRAFVDELDSVVIAAQAARQPSQ